MRIAQIAPLFECVPPRYYGGTERIVSYLTEELLQQGHDVTLFASGDSKTAGKLVPCCDVALRLNPNIRDPLPYHVIMLEQVRQRVDEFDVLHFHIPFMHALLVHGFVERTVTTQHGRLDLPDLTAFYAVFPELPLVAISNDQRNYLPHANWIATVHHGIPRELLPFAPKASGGYLAFLGRISPEKRPDRAIKIAARAGMPLKIAAKVDRADQSYWEEMIRPMVEAHSNVEFLGEIGEADKASFLGEAAALLFPIDWPEPFGLVMIEAMACGTPVIAFRRGSVSEILEHGTSGFIVDTIEEAVQAVQRIGRLSRAKVRVQFEHRFTAERMAHDYLDLYNLIGPHQPLMQKSSLRRVTRRANRDLLGYNDDGIDVLAGPGRVLGNVTHRRAAKENPSDARSSSAQSTSARPASPDDVSSETVRVSPTRKMATREPESL
jgi:glycosyltransferase involved in cell wall biosynthesis